jgi:hypothetical protein
MRSGLIVALGIAALVSGCDELGLGRHTAQAPAPPPCHCVAAPAPIQQVASTPPPAAHHPHRHHAHAYAQSWARQYQEPQSPSYSSESRSYYEGEESAASHESEAWVDGYGRSHYGEAHVTRVAADTHERRDPWHAYKSKCREKERE